MSVTKLSSLCQCLASTIFGSTVAMCLPARFVWPAVGEVGALLRLGVVGVGGDIGEIHGRHTGGVGVLLRLGVVGVEGEHALVVLVRARG